MSNEDTNAFISAVKQLLEPFNSSLTKIQSSIDDLQLLAHKTEACPNTLEIATIKEKMRKDEESKTKTVDKSRSVLWDVGKIMITAVVSIVAAYLMLRLGLK